MSLLTNWIISTLVIISAAYLIKGVQITDFTAALVAALVLGIINAVIKPILIILTLPINIVTLGLFTIIINAVLIMLTDALVPGFSVNNFWTAILFGLLLSVINFFLHLLKK